jgi:hypothetical protein
MAPGTFGLEMILKALLEELSRDRSHIASEVYHWAVSLLQSSISYANLRLLHSKMLDKMGTLWLTFSSVAYSAYSLYLTGLSNLLTDMR